MKRPAKPLLKVQWLPLLALLAVCTAWADTNDQSCRDINQLGGVFSSAFPLGQYVSKCLDHILADPSYQIPTGRTLTVVPKKILGEAQSACVDRYKNMYEDGHLDISIFFGYLDHYGLPTNSAPFMLDQALLFLRQPCPVNGKLMACGFTEVDIPLANSSGIRYLFSKTVPNLSGTMTDVSISLISSPISLQESQNIAPGKIELQQQRSAAVRELFINSFKKGHEFIAYVGHSRISGGPDFFPPLLLPNGHVDYDHYARERSGIRDILQALSEASAQKKLPQLYGSYSCDSQIFRKTLTEAAPKLARVLSEGLAYTNTNLVAMMATIESVLQTQCPRSMNRLMGEIMSTFPRQDTYLFRADNF